MSEKERLMTLLADALGVSRKHVAALACDLLNQGVVVLPAAVGSPCKVQKFITNRDGKIKKIEVEDAVVRMVCVLTESKSGSQIMSLSNVFPISEE